MTDQERTEEDDLERLCDCGQAFHELDCAFLDALMLAKFADGDIEFVDLP